MNIDYMTIAAIALEQINLLKAQNAQLIELNTRHVQQLEQLCEERDAAKEALKSVSWASDDLLDALKNWDFNAPSEFWIDVTPETRDAFAALKAYRAARDAVSE